MIANYHTHTFRCHHASRENESEYVEAAIRAGLKELGFADHCPMPLPNTVAPEQCTRFMGIRMTLDETDDYVNTLLCLRDKYKDDIKIHIGFEVEYIPETFADFLGFINQYPVDYIIMGQHFNTINTDEITYFGAETRSQKTLEKYVDLVTEGMRTGKFTYVAHPDLCHFHGSIDLYEKEMTRLINCANECQVPLEINLLGFDNMRHYPSLVFWQLASRIGCDVVLGSDAHDTSGVYPKAAIDHAKDLIDNNKGLHLLERVDFKTVK